MVSEAEAQTQIFHVYYKEKSVQRDITCHKIEQHLGTIFFPNLKRDSKH